MSCTRVSLYGKMTIDFRKQTRDIIVRLFIHKFGFSEYYLRKKCYGLQSGICLAFVSNFQVEDICMRDHLDFATFNTH